MKYPADPTAWHGLFPHTATGAWLNHAADTPLWQPVQERLYEWYEVMAARPHAVELTMNQTRALVAPLIGAGPDEIALMPNTTAGVAAVAQGIDWQPGDNVVLPAGGFKWLMGPPATGFLYVRRELMDELGVGLPGPLATESNIHDVEPRFDLWPDARRFEGGGLAWGEVHAWAGALELLGAAGMDRVWALAGARTAQAAAGLQQLGYPLVTPREPAAGRSAIVSFTCGSVAANTAAFARLAQAGRLRGEVLRVSPHAYNTAAEVDRFLDVLGRNAP